MTRTPARRPLACLACAAALLAAGCRSTPPPGAAPAQEPPAAAPAPVPPAPAALQPALPAEPATPAAPDHLSPGNLAHGAKVTASSTHQEWPGEGPAAQLVDGDVQTRWSSDYAEPQQVVLDLGRVVKLGTVRLHWEHAAALQYALSVSRDGQKWQTVHACLKSPGNAQAGVDEIAVKSVPAQFIKLDLQKRVSAEWGFSLYEIEVLPPDGG